MFEKLTEEQRQSLGNALRCSQSTPPTGAFFFASWGWRTQPGNLVLARVPTVKCRICERGKNENHSQLLVESWRVFLPPVRTKVQHLPASSSSQQSNS